MTPRAKYSRLREPDHVGTNMEQQVSDETASMQHVAFLVFREATRLLLARDVAAGASLHTLLVFYQEQSRAAHAYICEDRSVLEAALHKAQIEVSRGRVQELRKDFRTMLSELNAVALPFARREQLGIDSDSVVDALSSQRHGLAARAWSALATTGAEGMRQNKTTRKNKLCRSAMLFAGVSRIARAKLSVEDNAFGMVLGGVLSADGVKRRAFKTLSGLTALMPYPHRLDIMTDRLNAQGREALKTVLHQGGRAVQIATKGVYVPPLVSLCECTEEEEVQEVVIKEEEGGDAAEVSSGQGGPGACRLRKLSQAAMHKQRTKKGGFGKRPKRKKKGVVSGSSGGGSGDGGGGGSSSGGGGSRSGGDGSMSGGGGGSGGGGSGSGSGSGLGSGIVKLNFDHHDDDDQGVHSCLPQPEPQMA
jgi:hypothetical protein